MPRCLGLEGGRGSSMRCCAYGGGGIRGECVAVGGRGHRLARWGHGSKSTHCATVAPAHRHMGALSLLIGALLLGPSEGRRPRTG